MPTAILIVTLALAVGSAGLLAQAPAGGALSAMADTERAFAKRAAEVGVRDAFLEFFADDALAFAAAPVPARDGLKKAPSTPASEVLLEWEPRAGDAASSGELGFLTGPYTRTVLRDGKKRKDYGCYFSIWKKQADGAFKVFIDQGISMLDPCVFPDGFATLTHAATWTVPKEPTPMEGALLEADRALMQQMVRAGVAQPRVYAAALLPGVRIYRNDRQPVVGAAAAEAFLRTQAPLKAGAPIAAQMSAAEDFGYSYGTYSLEGVKPDVGHYVRVWARRPNGRWGILLDVTAQAPPQK